MRMSGGVTVTLLGGLMLTACLSSRGCGRHHVVPVAPDRTWYDANGQPVAEHWATDAEGKRFPDPHPHDRFGHPWPTDANGNLVPPVPPPTTYYHDSYWWWGGSGYRSYNTGPTYRSGTPSPATPTTRPASGSSPSTSSPSAKPSSSSSSSITRGGFGSTGMGGGG